MDIILEFHIRNHSGIDLHDTDIDFSGPIIFQKRTAHLTYYTSMRLFFLLFGGNPIFVIEAGNLLDSVKVPAYHLFRLCYLWEPGRLLVWTYLYS